MAHPADTASKGPAAFTGARISPDEAERLASMFRPSWELDDAPFSGAGTLTDADMRALQGGGTHAEVRAVAQAAHVPEAAHATNGAHLPPAPTQSHEPENSVIIDRSITADAMPAPVRPNSTILGMAPPTMPQPVAAPAPAPAPTLQRPPTPIPQRPQAPDFTVGPPSSRPSRPAHLQAQAQSSFVQARPRPSIDEYPKKKAGAGLWVGLGVGGVAVIGLVGWLVASSGGAKSGTAAEAVTTTAATTVDKLSSVPPPPPATAAATADPTPPATAAAAVNTPAPTAATPIPTTPVTALPQAAPVPTHVAAGNAPRPNYGAPAPSPAPRPGGKKATIVRDVPF